MLQVLRYCQVLASPSGWAAAPKSKEGALDGAAKQKPTHDLNNLLVLHGSDETLDVYLSPAEEFVNHGADLRSYLVRDPHSQREPVPQSHGATVKEGVISSSPKPSWITAPLLLELALPRPSP